jgi:hypothetical protein
MHVLLYVAHIYARSRRWTRSSWAFLNEPPPPPTTTREEVVFGSRAPRSFVVVACDQQLHAAARIVTGNA